MENSKLFKILRQLNKDETDAFRKFVASPYFNNRSILLAFLDLILKEELLSKETIDNEFMLIALYPGNVTHPRMMHDLTYRLMNLLEEFLEFEKYRQNRFQRKINLMMLAYEKEMEPLIPGIEKALEDLHSSSDYRDSNYLYETFVIHSERDYSFRLSGKITDNNSLQQKSENLDLFYLAQKLKDNCEILNRSRIVSSAYDPKMFRVIIDYLLVHPEIYENQPAINIYLQIYLMLSTAEHEQYYLKLKTLILDYEKAFPTEELRSIYVYLQNYCIRRMNQGSPDYYMQLFGIYKHILATSLVFGDNKNMQWDFKNFVSLGLRIKEYAWTLEMINTFKEKLPEALRHNAYMYNLANYYYETAEYKKATKLLNTVEFTDMYYSLGAKAILMKIYYKVDADESFYSLVSSFALYIRRNKLISKENAEIYNNFIRFTKKVFILKSKLPYQRKKDFYEDVETLKQKLKQTPKIANVDWLLQELDMIAA